MKQITQRCYIGLGSNLGDSATQLHSAVQQLIAHPKIDLIACSRFYRSQPHGPQDQPDYINAVAAISTALPALSLLHELFAIEHQHGRERSPDNHWGARTLDLDLLLYGDEIIDEPDLKVPHPYLGERSFVVYPLSELNPQLKLPTGQSIQDYKQQLPGDDLFALDTTLTVTGTAN